MGTCTGGDAKPPAEEEAAARDLLTAWIDGSLVHVDPPDFIICRDGRLLGGVEVTRSTDEGFLRLGSQLSRHGHAIESNALTSSWLALLSWSDANLRRFDKSRAVAVVRALEEVGLSSDRDVDEELAGELERLGIARLIQISRDEAPVHRIFLQPEARATFIDPAAVDAVVLDAAQRKRAVLSRIQGRRHLFVWIDPWNVESAAALDSEPTLNPPPLPTWVDEVWVAPAFGDINRLWHRSGEDPWRVLTD